MPPPSVPIQVRPVVVASPLLLSRASNVSLPPHPAKTMSSPASANVFLVTIPPVPPRGSTTGCAATEQESRFVKALARTLTYTKSRKRICEFANDLPRPRASVMVRGHDRTRQPSLPQREEEQEVLQGRAEAARLRM